MSEKTPAPRKGMPDPHLDHATFRERFLSQYRDPAFQALASELEKIAAVAWEAYEDGRKAPLTRKAGAEFADPDYDLSVDWIAARAAIAQAKERHEDPKGPHRYLLINCSSRSEHTCPGEMSKSYRMVEIAREVLEGDTSEVQTQDWMNDIYPMWVEAHGVMIITPVNWYQVSSPLKLMMDRLVCADGGNPDPTLTHGKDATQAKTIELAGWDYPRHLEGRLFACVVHGDVEGAENVRRSISDWLCFMHMCPAGPAAELDRYIGYWKPYATSHTEFDGDKDVQEEVRNAARALKEGVEATRTGKMITAGNTLKAPRQK